MIGKQNRWQEDLFVACSLRDLIPDDHILKRVDRVLDLCWLGQEVRDVYEEDMGRPSIDPEAAVRLMLAGLFQGIVHDHKLLRVEGVHGEAKKWHGLGRAIRRGLCNVQIQAYLTAAVINLKRLAGWSCLPQPPATAMRGLAGSFMIILRCWRHLALPQHAARPAQEPTTAPFDGKVHCIRLAA